MDEGSAHLEAGNRALENEEWSVARDAFRSALEADETPAEALFGLAEALWWLGDLQGTIAYCQQAYAAFRHRSDSVSAAAVALRLAFDCRVHLANDVVADGWLARAERLIEGYELEGLRGELLFIKAHGAGNAVRSEEWSREALQLARQSEDLDLELLALSQLGAALVEQGKIEDGLALLDEALAGSLGGEPEQPSTTVFTSCNMMVSCVNCADFERAMKWVRAAERFAQNYSCPFLYVECRTIYGFVLKARGDWTEAQQQLETAVELARETIPSYFAQAVATLSELRLAQGRIEEAKRLLMDVKGHSATVPVLAQIHLTSGKPSLAATEVRRRLDVVGPNQLESVHLLELLGEAEIALGKVEAAVDRGRTLTERGAASDCEISLARGKRLWGHALSHRDAQGARRHLDEGLSRFIQLEMPYEAGKTRLLLAEAMREDEPQAAAEEAQTALDLFERLGASRDADRAASLLRELGEQATRAGPKGLKPITKRERDVLLLLGEGLSNPEIAERLFISRKTVEHHVSSILSKLGLKNRTEAAVVSVRRFGHGSTEK